MKRFLRADGQVEFIGEYTYWWKSGAWRRAERERQGDRKLPPQQGSVIRKLMATRAERGNTIPPGRFHFYRHR